MNFSLKKIVSKINNYKKNKYKYDKYDKYDKIIDDNINNIKNISDKEYKIDKYIVNRNIPNKNDLKEMYNTFIKNKQINVNNIEFTCNKKIENLVLKNDNQYILIYLNLQKDKRYRLNLNFETNNTIEFNIIFVNDKYSKCYNINESINGNIQFNTNHKHLVHYCQLYILFKKQIPIYIKKFNLNIQEIINNNEYNISLIKYNNKIKIF